MTRDLSASQLTMLLDYHDGDHRRYYPSSTVKALRRRGLIDDDMQLTPEGDKICEDLNHRLETEPTTLAEGELEALDHAHGIDDDTLTRIILNDESRTTSRLWAFRRLSYAKRETDTFTRLAHDADPRMRLEYCKESRAASSRLEELYRDETDPNVLICLLDRLHPEQAEKYLTHENPEVRFAALKRLPEEKRSEQACRMLDDPDMKVFDMAIRWADRPLTGKQTERALGDEKTALSLASYGVGMTADTIRRLLDMGGAPASIMRYRLDDYRDACREMYRRERLFDDPDMSTVACEYRDNAKREAEEDRTPTLR